MRKIPTHPLALALGLALFAVPPCSLANPDPASDTTARTTDSPEMAEMRAQIAELTRRLDEMAQTARAAQDIAQHADENATQAVKTASASSDAFSNARSKFHLTGYGFADFNAPRNGNAGFNSAAFNPIFHWLLDDNLLFEAELEFEVAPDGSTETNLEYASIDWMFSDYATLVAGRFLSPLGNFRQNLHPAWINRFATAPLGFGEDGAAAAPLGELGVQLRGGWDTASLGKFNYAAYVGNGPELDVEEDALGGLNTEGVARNTDGNLAVGGRLGWLPVPEIEIGVSYANGRTSVTDVEGVEVEGEPDRSYSFYGADLAWHPLRGLELRGEYARQRAGGAVLSVAPDAAVWRSWYSQVAYTIPNTSWELVGRYGDFKATSNPLMSARQAGLGVNYWLATKTVVKAGYEFNNPDLADSDIPDQLVLQIAHGF